MRILFVIPYFYPTQAFGGPVKVAYHIARELVKRKHACKHAGAAPARDGRVLAALQEERARNMKHYSARRNLHGYSLCARRS